MKKTAYQSQKIFYAFHTVCTLTVFGGDALHALERAKARILAISKKNGESNPVAVGYAAEEAYRILCEESIHEARISIGGLTRNLGCTRRVGIQNPFGEEGESFAFLDLGEKAMVSRCSDASLPCRTDALASVTLIGDNAVQLEALCGTALKLTVQNALSLLNDTEVEAIFVTMDQQVFTTSGLRRDREIERRAAA